MPDTPDTAVSVVVGTLHDGRVLVDFRTQNVDHLKLTVEQTFELAEGLIEAAQQASRHGRIIDTGCGGG